MYYLALFGICLSLFMYIQADNRPYEALGGSGNPEELFKRLYKLERMEQLEAVKTLLKLENPNKQIKMVDAIAEKIFTVIQKSRTILDAAGYVPGESNFPLDDKIRDALSNVLENTAFLSDVVIRLPEMSLKVLQRNPEWIYLLKWSLNFTNQTKLIDSRTNALINLVSQELNFTKRSVNHTNPFSKKTIGPPKEPEMKKKEKKKKVLPRGPRLSSRQSGDL